MKMVKRVLIAIVVFLLLPLMAEEMDDRTESPYISIEGEDLSTESFPLKSTDVSAEIDGVIARVNVVQTYQNRGDVPINAAYIFPASTRAAVHKMEMVINGHVIAAKVQEKRKAQATFDQAKREGKSASLLKQQRPNVFSMNLANILPGDEVVIELEYTELLIPTDGIYSFVYPTVVGPRYNGKSREKWQGNPFLSAGEKPKETFSITTSIRAGMALQDLICKTHKTQINWLDAESATIALDGSDMNSGNRDYILNYRLQGNQIETGMLYEKGDENHFLLMVQPPKAVTTDFIPPREYIFVVDVSGSMDGFPLNTSKRLMTELIGSLRSSDKFNVVLFAGASQLLSPQSLPATEQNLQRAIRLIDNQSGGGGTELLSAMKRAVATPKIPGVSRSVIMISDGYISAEQECFDYISGSLNNTNFFSFGIGSSVNRYLIEGLAKVGLGEAFVVTNGDEAVEKARAFKQYVESPLLTDIKVKYRGFNAYDIEPKSLPDMFAERPLLIFGKWKGSMNGTVEITGKTGNGEFRETINLNDVYASEESGALSYLWARKRIERLSDYNSGSISPSQEEEIVDLGLKYNLLTKYTSFVAVSEEVRTSDAAKDVAQPRAIPQGVSNKAVGSMNQSYSVNSTPEPGFILLLLGGVAMVILYGRRKARRDESASL